MHYYKEGDVTNRGVCSLSKRQHYRASYILILSFLEDHVFYYKYNSFFYLFRKSCTSLALCTTFFFAFTFNLTEPFAQNSAPVQVLKPGIEPSGDFGWDFDVRDSVMIVGARYNDGDAGPSEGSAFIYEMDTDGRWQFVQKIKPPDPEARAFFGWSVSISSDGQTAVVGALRKDHFKDGTNHSSLGAAYVFRNNDDGLNWVFTQKLIPTIVRSQRKFGEVVHISDDGQDLFVTEEEGSVSWFKSDGTNYGLVTAVWGSAAQIDYGRNLMFENNLLSIASPYATFSFDHENHGAISVLEPSFSDQSFKSSDHLRSATRSEDDRFSWRTSSNENFIIASSVKDENNLHLFKYEQGTYQNVFTKSVPQNTGIAGVAVSDALIAYSTEWDRDGNGTRDGNIIRIFANDGLDYPLIDSIYTALDERIELGLGEMKIQNGHLYAGAIDDEGGALYIYEIAPSEIKVEMYDANPKFIKLGFLGATTVEDIRELTDVTQLHIEVNEKRDFVAADGITKVLLKIPSPEALENFAFVLKEEHGTITYPWGKDTYEIDGNHIGFALYQAPKVFPEGVFGLVEGVKTVSVPYSFFGASQENGIKEFKADLQLIRPPVVLVHGTFDNPENCWKTPIRESANTLVQALELRQFKVFTVDYSASNGAKDDNFLFTEPTSSFESNKKVVFNNPGGIKDALMYYNTDLNAAATQADIVGHSMGGVLPRVLASDDEFLERYNDDYYRSENFEGGDINRLITIASTHHGSDLSYFQHFFTAAWKNSELPLHERLSLSSIPYTAWMTAGATETGAVRDQVPVSLALRKIGPTPIPSHAIVGTVKDIRSFETNSGEPETFTTYANILNAATAFFYFYKGGLRSFLINLLREYKRLPSQFQSNNIKASPFPALPHDAVLAASNPKRLNELVQQIDDGFTAFWQDWHLLLDAADDDWYIDDDEYLLQYETAEYQPFDIDDDFNNFIIDERWDIISGEYLNTDVIKNDRTQSAIDFLRYLIFKNDLNDGVVRYESQTGGLAAPYITHFDNHIHSYIHRDPEVINKIVSLLEGGLKDFAEGGFPGAGRKMSNAIPDPDYIDDSKVSDLQDHREGCEAACWSGMVITHAEAFAEVARDRDVVILSRPVNPDATVLIEQGAATKGMNLKGKSSNWGPQKGYIPVQQRYSKIWNLYGDSIVKRDNQVIKFTGKTTTQLMESPDEAVRRNLKISYDCPDEQEFDVHFNDQVENAEEAIYLVQREGASYKVFNWVMNSGDECPIEFVESVDHLGDYDTMYVMASPRFKDNLGLPRYYTADYDLLAIGRKIPGLAGREDDPYKVDTLRNFDKHKGLITPYQLGLLDDLNEAVRAKNYTGGDVSHHGPENQFYVLDDPKEGSPYVDYPITAFYRENGEGKIMSIPRGKKGYRDIHLKHFMARMRRNGYDLYENVASPGWDWSHSRPYSFERGWDDQDKPGLTHGPEEIPFPADACNCANNKVDETSLVTDESLHQIHEIETNKLRLFPNPAYERINISILSKEATVLEYYILQLDGISIDHKNIQLRKGRNDVSIPVQNLRSGSYVLLLKSDEKTVSKKFNIVQP